MPGGVFRFVCVIGAGTIQIYVLNILKREPMVSHYEINPEFKQHLYDLIWEPQIRRILFNTFNQMLDEAVSKYTNLSQIEAYNDYPI